MDVDDGSHEAILGMCTVLKRVTFWVTQMVKVSYRRKLFSLAVFKLRQIDISHRRTVDCFLPSLLRSQTEILGENRLITQMFQ